MTTPRDPLAAALREALDAERPLAGDDALIARAIARATTTLAAPAAKATTSSNFADSSSKVAASKVSTSATESTRVLSLSRPRSRFARLALPFAAAFVASIAMASVYVSSQSVEPQPAPSIEVPEPATAEAPTETTQNLPVEPPPEPSFSVHDLPSAKPLAAVTSDTVSFSPPPPPADSPVTAAELFRDANAERRAGNIGKAIDLYRSLQKRHPDAPETQAARVSLGRLLLDRQDDPNGALAQFDAYLKGSPADGGTLAEEARVGRALAFEKLGRRDDERRAWEDLLSKHPQSLHSARARDRLSILDGMRDTPFP